jgi:hypothetical protein
MPYFPPVGGGVLLPNSIDNALLADMAAGTVKGRALGAGFGDPTDLTAQQLAAIQGLGYPIVRHDCRFDYISATTCRLTRYGGALITIDAQLQVIPAAGVNLTWIAGYNYSGIAYAYVYMLSGVMTMYAENVAPVLDPRDGNSVHPSNPALSFVGAFWGTTPGFKQDAATIGVISAWNRINRAASASGAPATASTAAVPLLTPMYFVTLGDEAMMMFCTGYVANNTAGGAISTNLEYEAQSVGAYQAAQSYAGGAMVPVACSAVVMPAAGVRGVMPYGWVNTGTATWGTLAAAISVRG